MRVKYLKDLDFTPTEDRRVTYAKRAGDEETVKREWGEVMVSEGNAEEIKTHTRQADDAGSR